jgi:REP element-mobilizing transposase RayT
MNHEPMQPMQLSRAIRTAASRALIATAQRRAWRLHAHNVLVDHVHVVISASAAREEVVHGLKAFSTRALRRSGLISQTDPVWSRGGSVERLLTLESARRAVHYVLHRQAEPGVEGEPL